MQRICRLTSGRLSAITGASERPLAYRYLPTELGLPRIRFRVIGFEGSVSVPGPQAWCCYIFLGRPVMKRRFFGAAVLISHPHQPLTLQQLQFDEEKHRHDEVQRRIVLATKITLPDALNVLLRPNDYSGPINSASCCFPIARSA